MCRVCKKECDAIWRELPYELCVKHGEDWLNYYKIDFKAFLFKKYLEKL